ncbi:hypothetical protein CUJ91_00525 [Paraburkholderia graminis]|nr:hypothetical protein CUJ91_00525 [Paraburkholderia graminis]
MGYVCRRSQSEEHFQIFRRKIANIFTFQVLLRPHARTDQQTSSAGVPFPIRRFITSPKTMSCNYDVKSSG